MVLGFASGSAVSHAQDDEIAGDARSDYAWGDGGGGGASLPEDPLRIIAFAGVGGGFRLIQNLDFKQDFSVPVYLDVGGAVFFPGGDIRHGVGLTLSTNLTSDASSAVSGGQQWAIAPAYHIDLPLRRLLGMEQDWLHLMGRFGLPIIVGAAYDGGGGTDVSLGVEVGASLIFKFLAGLGVYLEAQLGVYGGSEDTLHPIVTVDGGFVFDYEVLP